MPTTFHQLNRNHKNTFTTPQDSHAAYKSYMRKVLRAVSKKHSKVISQARKNRGKFVGDDQFPTYELNNCLNDDASILVTPIRTRVRDVKQDPRQTMKQRICNKELMEEGVFCAYEKLHL